MIILQFIFSSPPRVEKSQFTDERTYCILCSLCVRYCEEIKKEMLQHSLAEEPIEKVAVVPEKADVCELAGSSI